MGADAHGLRGLDPARIDARQRGIDLAGEERDGAEHQRHDYAPHADARAHDELGQVHQHGDEDDERNGAEQVDDLVQHLIDRAVFEDAPPRG